ADHRELSGGLEHEPRPAGAEFLLGDFREAIAELFEGPEGRRELVVERPAGITAAVRPHAVPEEIVVPDLGRVVEDGPLRGADDLDEILLREGRAPDRL